MSLHVTNFIRDLFKSNGPIPLHAPAFGELDKTYVVDTLTTTFVSSVGQYVDDFERGVREFTGASQAVATVNGTAALHTALKLSGVEAGDFVITQALTFVATCNAIHHLGATPVFVDVSETTLGLCPFALESYLIENAQLTPEGCIDKKSGRPIRAVVPMHTFGHPVHLREILAVCKQWQLELIEDAAESLGSFYDGQHTGTIGRFGALSFNGNKIITTGGGGMLLCGDQASGAQAKHITTTAKVAHPYEFYHDQAGFNYRMPNLNAALGCAQLTRLPSYLAAKRKLASAYREFFAASNYQFVDEPAHGQSNFWLNAVVCADKASRDEFLVNLNQAGIMCRPVWQLMHRLPMYTHCPKDSLQVSEYLESRLVNLPSSPIIGQQHEPT